ncbi:MAG: trigger factor [Cyanobacteria bacterium REEB67]|nr:trigger factor [Cyanobacteria bacterium REEB67]
MKVTLEREGKNIVKLSLELETDRVSRAYEMACRQLSQQVRIPGFRPGKAPRMIIEKTVGEENIKRETLERLVPELINEAIYKENLDIITAPEYSNFEFKLGQPLKFDAKFEVRPEVVLGNYQEIEVNVPEVKLPEDALERALTNVAETKASLQTVEGKPVEVGNTAVIDFECRVDGNIIDGGKAEGMLLEVKEGSFLPGFCEQLVGHNSGDNFKVKATFPADYRRKEIAGKEAEFDVTLKEIRNKNTPAIDDELAKSVGHDTLDALKESVIAELGEVVKQENEARAQRMVVEAVAHLATVDIPETMVERERELLIGQVRRYIEQGGQTWEEFEGSDDYKQMIESKMSEARQRVLTSLVLGAVVREEKLTVNDEEMIPYLADLAMRYNLRPDQFEEFAGNEEVRRQVAEEVLTGKVVELLIGKAKINYVPDDGCHEDHDHSQHEHGHEHGDKEKKAAKAEKTDKAEKADKGEAKAEAKPEAKSEAKAEAKGDAKKAKKKD